MTWTKDFINFPILLIFFSIFQPHALTNPRCTSKARPGKMDASTSVLALMPPRDSTHVNNCKIHFKNFNVLRVFLYHNVKKGWGDQGRGEIICQMGVRQQ